MTRKSVKSIADKGGLRVDPAKPREAERTLPDGRTVTIAPSTYSGYDVDMWNADGTNHWHKFHFVWEDALYEFNRWK